MAINTRPRFRFPASVLAAVLAAFVPIAALAFVACGRDDKAPGPDIHDPDLTITGVAISPSYVPDMDIGRTTVLTAAVQPDAAPDKTVRWSSSRPEVASVDAFTDTTNAMVKALSAGTTDITAAAVTGGKTATRAVTVNAPPPPPPWVGSENADVYIVGEDFWVFKNGQKMPLGLLPNAHWCRGKSVFVDGDDVYVAGEMRGRYGSGVLDIYAVQWKNGVPQRLGREWENPPDYRYDSTANSVYVSGGHVYVSGYDDYMNPNDDGRIDRMPVLWVDGAPQVLPTYSSGEAVSVSVTPSGDVYVGGNFGATNADIWKNGVLHWDLPSTRGWGSKTCYSVFVVGDDVYAAGHDDKPLLWKNGELWRVLAHPQLDDGGSNYDVGSAYTLFVSDGDVYVGGYYNELVGRTTSGYAICKQYAVLWKNGEMQRLTKGKSSLAYVRSVFVSNGDVYAVGYESGWTAPDGNHHPEARHLWINGEAIDLGLYGVQCGARVFVVEKGKQGLVSPTNNKDQE